MGFWDGILFPQICMNPVTKTFESESESFLTEINSLYQLDFPSAGTTDYASMSIDRPLSALTIAFWMISTDTGNYGTVFSYAVPNMDNALTLTDYNG